MNKLDGAWKKFIEIQFGSLIKWCKSWKSVCVSAAGRVRVYEIDLEAGSVSRSCPKRIRVRGFSTGSGPVETVTASFGLHNFRNRIRRIEIRNSIYRKKRRSGPELDDVLMWHSSPYDAVIFGIIKILFATRTALKRTSGVETRLPDPDIVSSSSALLCPTAQFHDFPSFQNVFHKMNITHHSNENFYRLTSTARP